MKLGKKLVLVMAALTSAVASSQSAAAADVQPARNWGGMWLGFGAGYAGTNASASGGRSDVCLTSETSSGIAAASGDCVHNGDPYELLTTANTAATGDGGVVAGTAALAVNQEPLTASITIGYATASGTPGGGSATTTSAAVASEPGSTISSSSGSVNSYGARANADGIAQGDPIAAVANDPSASFSGVVTNSASFASLNSANTLTGLNSSASYASVNSGDSSAEALAIGFTGLPTGDLSGRDGGLSPDIHLRYDYQTESNVIFGAELDLSMPGGDGPSSALDTKVGLHTEDYNSDLSLKRGYNVDSSALASARLRLGYAMGDYMVYGTGGLAYTHVNATAFTTGNFDGHAVSESAKGSDDAFGGVVGGGISTFVSDNAAVSLEGLYYRFDDQVEIDSGNEKMSVSLDDAFSVMMKFSIRAN